MAAEVPRVSLPSSWFLDPFFASIRKMVRPSTATTRRKELTLDTKMPREIFEEIMAPVNEGEVVGLTRDPATNRLLPTSTTRTLNKFEYMIRRGGVSDRLFHLGTLDPPEPKPAKTEVAPPAEVAAIGEEDVFEVEEISDKRKRGTITEYFIKWLHWPAENNTWERASRIDPALVAAFEGKPPPKKRRRLAPELPKRGAGCARAQLSKAEQRRGAVPEVMSMVCGNVRVEFEESIDESTMPSLKLIFYVMSMDKTGHIIWPTAFEKTAQAQIRLQARALLKKMIDDPLNPCDTTMEPALHGAGTGALWKPPPKRKMIVVTE